ncbi:hypothetical protein [Streptomyces achromogenes]|uniref:hypothetical protein n=1 Tax=Streptomyces achromogenes TaxID=67255 RepID=UPI003676770B
MAAGAFRIFHVASGGDLRLDDVTVRGGGVAVLQGATGVITRGWFTLDQFTVIRSTIKDNIPANCAGSPVIVTGCVN